MNIRGNLFLKTHSKECEIPFRSECLFSLRKLCRKHPSKYESADIDTGYNFQIPKFYKIRWDKRDRTAAARRT